MADTFEGEIDVIGFPKVTITALKNFPLSVGSETRRDGSIVFCVETNKLYRWDAGSTETPDNDDVILSNLSGTGRWLAIGEFVKNLAHLGDNQTFTGNNTFSTGLLSNGFITVTEDSNSIVIGDGEIVTSGGIYCAGADIKNNKVINLADPTNPLDGVNLQTLDAHPGTQPTLVANFTVDDPPSNTYTLPSDPAPNPSEPSFLLYNGVVYTAIRGDYSIVGTTLTWLEPFGIELTTGSSLVLFYNAAIDGGGGAQNISEKGFGLNVKHQGDNNWSSTSNIVNHLWQLNEDNPSDPFLIKRTSYGLAPDTLITPENSNIDYFITRDGFHVPHQGIATAAREIGDLPNISMVRSGSTVTVENDYIITQFNLKIADVGDKVFVRDVVPTDYNGIQTITSVDVENKKYTFEIAGTPAQPTSYGTTVIHYKPKPYMNNAVFKYSLVGTTSPAFITLKTDLSIPNGYSFSVLAANSSEDVDVLIDDSSVKLRGMKSNTWLSNEWTQSSSPKPRLHTWMIVTFFYAGTEGGSPIWYIRNGYVL